MPRIQLLDSWRGYPNYRLIWTANFFANSAQWLQLLTVGWLVQRLAEGAAATATTTAAGAVAVAEGAADTAGAAGRGVVAGRPAGVPGRGEARRCAGGTRTAARPAASAATASRGGMPSRNSCWRAPDPFDR